LNDDIFNTPPYWPDRDITLWCSIEAGLGIFATSAYTLRPLFRSISSASARQAFGYSISNTSGRRIGYMQNKARPPSHTDNTSHGAPGQNVGISLSIGLMDSKSHVASPFSDSNELAIQPIADASEEEDLGWEMGNVQSHLTFEITSADDNSNENERHSQTPVPSGSSVSIV
jgi:hypothetical protein